MRFDATFFAFVGLVIFAGIVIYMKVPGMVASMLDKRAETIRHDLAEARRLRDEAEALLADYRKRARDAETEAESIMRQARHGADALAACPLPQ